MDELFMDLDAAVESADAVRSASNNTKNAFGDTDVLTPSSLPSGLIPDTARSAYYSAMSATTSFGRHLDTIADYIELDIELTRLADHL